MPRHKGIDRLTKSWIRDASDDLAAKAGARFDMERAMFTVNWIQEYCHLYEGECAGQRMILHDWQLEATMRLFGWVMWSDHWNREVRRFTQAGIWVPKKNKKSPTLAAWEAYMLIGEGEMGQKTFTAALDLPQAMIAHTHLIHMIEMSGALADDCRINHASGVIQHLPSKSIARPLAGTNITGQEGLNGSVFKDETHVVDARLASVLKGAGISRAEPLDVEVSTAGNNPEGYGASRIAYGRDVAAGRIVNHKMLFMEYAAPQELTPEKFSKNPIKFGKLSNPAWGHTINPEEFTASWDEAKKKLSTTLDFFMYRLNVWQRSANPWIKQEDWSRCARPKLTLNDFVGRTCFMGLDLGRTRDMSAIAVTADGDDDEVMAWVEFWMPYNYAAANNHLVPFLEWGRAWLINLTPGDIVDQEAIKERAKELVLLLNPQSFRYDRMYADPLATWINAETGIEIVEVQQSIRGLALPTAEMEKKIIAGKFIHADHPVLNWQIGHVEVITDNNMNRRAVKPDRKKDDVRKIDGIAALTNAMDGIVRNESSGTFDMSMYR